MFSFKNMDGNMAVKRWARIVECMNVDGQLSDKDVEMLCFYAESYSKSVDLLYANTTDTRGRGPVNNDGPADSDNVSNSTSMVRGCLPIMLDVFAKLIPILRDRCINFSFDNRDEDEQDVIFENSSVVFKPLPEFEPVFVSLPVLGMNVDKTITIGYVVEKTRNYIVKVAVDTLIQHAERNKRLIIKVDGIMLDYNQEKEAIELQFKIR